MHWLKKTIIFNPIWLAEHGLNREIKSAIAGLRFGEADKWLDVGCGLRPYESCFPSGTYIGLDVEVSGRNASLKVADHYYDGRILPFPNDSLEGVICTQVLEHVPDPLFLLGEMYRVIKPGGRLLVSLPFVWQEHEEPYDFFRYTRFGISELLVQNGFKVDSIVKDTGSIETLASGLNAYISNNLVPPIRGVWVAFALGICFPIQIIALALQRVLPDKRKLYLNMIVQATKGNDIL